MSLTPAQQQVLNVIENLCFLRGLTTEEAVYIAQLAGLESTLNPDAENTVYNEDGTVKSHAEGLFQYTDTTWNERGQGGDRSDPVDSTNTFINDYLNFRDEYYSDDPKVQRRKALLEKNGIEPTL